MALCRATTVALTHDSGAQPLFRCSAILALSHCGTQSFWRSAALGLSQSRAPHVWRSVFLVLSHSGAQQLWRFSGCVLARLFPAQVVLALSCWCSAAQLSCSVLRATASVLEALKRSATANSARGRFLRSAISAPRSFVRSAALLGRSLSCSAARSVISVLSLWRCSRACFCLCALRVSLLCLHVCLQVIGVLQSWDAAILGACSCAHSGRRCSCSSTLGPTAWRSVLPSD